MKYVLLLLLNLQLHRLHATTFGHYIDNGKYQTVLDEKMSQKESEEFEKSLLDILDLPEVSERSKPPVVSNSSAPLYLKQMYDLLEGKSSKTNLHLPKDFSSAEKSDIIMTFSAKKTTFRDVGQRHDKSKGLAFILSDKTIENIVINSELRLFKRRKSQAQTYTIKIHELTANLNGENEEFSCIDTVNVTNEFEGWLSFNLTSTFIFWTIFPYRSREIFVSVHSRSNTGVREVGVSQAGIIFPGSEVTDRHAPFLVTFFNYKNDNNRIKRKRTRRDVGTVSDEPPPLPLHEEGKSISSRSNPFIPDESILPYRLCQIQTMYVSFDALKWQEWVIAPLGFAAYYCSGLCEFPLSAHLNATNHAIVQTLVHFLEPNMAPKASCVPTKLGSISLLYFTYNNVVILKKFRNMIVLDCGCH